MSDVIIHEGFTCNDFEFDKRFGNEQACRDYLSHMKQPDEFRCRKCNHTKYWISSHILRGLLLMPRLVSPKAHPTPKGSYLSFHLSIFAYDLSRGPDLLHGRIDHKNISYLLLPKRRIAIGCRLRRSMDNSKHHYIW